MKQVAIIVLLGKNWCYQCQKFYVDAAHHHISQAIEKLSFGQMTTCKSLILCYESESSDDSAFILGAPFDK